MGRGKTCQRKSRTSLNFQVYVGFSYIASISFTCLSAFREFKNLKKKNQISSTETGNSNLTQR